MEPTRTLTSAFLTPLGPRIQPYSKTSGPARNTGTSSSLASGTPTPASVSAPPPGTPTASATSPAPSFAGGPSLTDAFLGVPPAPKGPFKTPGLPQISLPPLKPLHSTLFKRPKSVSAINRANHGIGLSNAGPLQHAMRGLNAPLMHRLRERSEHEVFKNVYNGTMPKPYLLDDQP